MAQVIQLLTQRQVTSWRVCEGKVTEEELKVVINKTNQSKSPGTDGIPYEYYKQHLEEISPFLVQYYNSIIEQGALGPSMLEGITTLMFKEKGASTHIKNYRPITLLNCDLKIFTAILALRLAKVIHVVCVLCILLITRLPEARFGRELVQSNRRCVTYRFPGVWDLSFFLFFLFLPSY